MAQEIQATIEQVSDSDSGTRSRTRSSIEFPYADLDTAIDVTKAVYHRGGRCARDELAATLGHDSVISGTFRLKIVAARMFGLVAFDRDEVTITPLGRRIVDPQHEREARVEAFLSIPLYERIYESHRGFALPQDIGLEREMVQIGVAPKQKDRARQVFQRSAAQAGFFENGRERLVKPSSSQPSPPEPSRLEPDRSPIQPRPFETDLSRQVPATKFGGSGGGKDSGSPGGSGIEPMSNKLIAGLVEELPPLNQTWSQEDLTAWIQLAEMILKKVYKLYAESPVVHSEYEQEHRST